MNAKSKPLLLLSPLGLALLGALLLFLLGGISGLFVPTALELGEPYVVSASWFLSQGGSLYAPVTQEPFLHNNYNPLVQLLLAPAMAAVGPSYLPFRLLSLLSSIGALLLIGLTVRRETGSRWGWLAGLLPLLSGLVFNWYFLARVDAFAWFLATLGGFIAFKHREGTARQRAWFLVPAILAFAAKQSMLGTTLAVLLYGEFRGRRKEVFVQGLVFSLGCGLVVLLTNLSSDGESFLHTIVYNAGHQRAPLFGAENLRRMLSALRLPMMMLFVVSLFVRQRGAPWIVWFLASFPLALWMASKSGSHVHYYHESMTAMSIAVGIGMTRLVTSTAFARSTLRWMLLVLSLVLLQAWAAVAHDDWQIVKRYLRESRQEAVVPPEVRKRLEADPRPALMFGNLAQEAIACGRPALFDMADFVRLQDAGRFSPAEHLFPLLHQQRFSVIAFPKWGREVPRQFQLRSLRDLEPAVKTHYRLLVETKRGAYFVPREW